MTVLTERGSVCLETAGAGDPSELPLERVEAEICTLAGQIAAATCRFLRLLAEFDAREGWAGWQVRSCAQWLSWRCGLDLRTAREHVRVARALTDLPLIESAFAGGRVSYSKVRALTRVATPETEADLLEAALTAPASQVERLVRGLRVATDHTTSRRRRTGVRWWWDDDGSLVVSGRLVAEDGARLLAGLTRMEHLRTASEAASTPEPAEPPAHGDGSAEPQAGSPQVAGRVPADLGPALVATAELACSTTEAPTCAPGAEVVVHADLDAFVDAVAQTDAQTVAEQPPGVAYRPARLDDGPGLTSAVLTQLACDGRVHLSADGPDGRTLDLGRRRRRPTKRQLAVLWRRDRGCAVPGCGRTRFLHAHHVRPWALGGKTSLDNLVLLCGEHHRLLHQGAFRIEVRGRQRFRFRGTGDTGVPAAPGTRGSADAIAAAHREIAPTTIEPSWDGSPLDVAATVGTYLAAWRRVAAPPSSPSASG